MVARTVVDRTAVDRTAVDRTAAGRTAADRIVVAGRTAAVGCIAVAHHGCRL